MCLATVYKSDDNAVLFRNVSRIDVEGDTVYDDLYKEVKCLEKEYYEYQNNKQYVQRDSVESEFNKAQLALCRWALDVYNRTSQNSIYR